MEANKCFKRILTLVGISFLCGFVLTVQLIRIQVFNHITYTLAAAKQRQKTYYYSRISGSFYDRNLRVIRGPVTARYLLVSNGNEPEAVIQSVFTYFPASFKREYQKNRSNKYWVYSRELSWAQQKYIRKLSSPAFQITEGLAKRDSFNGLAWHILGINRSGEGKSGLESSLHFHLHQEQIDQRIFTVVDGIQSVIPGLGLRVLRPESRNGVVLTLDSRMQQVVESVMDREQIKGAVVLMHVQSGQILAMASRPVVKADRINDSLNSPDQPFLNRAISAYHPGSIFKLIILSAGLDSGQLGPDLVFDDPGYYKMGERQWLCTTSSPEGHGQINLTDALAYSCNPVFIEALIRLKPKLVLDYAERMGLGAPSNLGLTDESWGNLPTDIGLTLGEQANLALGQQCITATPLQIASIVQMIANDGIRHKPMLIKGLMNQEGTLNPIITERPQRVLKLETARMIQKMMAAVTSYGTGTEAQLPGGAAGKTGTAQIGTDQDLPDHAWFAGYAPLKNPRYVAVIFCEKGVSGGKTAAPIFKEIMEKVNMIKD